MSDLDLDIQGHFVVISINALPPKKPCLHNNFLTNQHSFAKLPEIMYHGELTIFIQYD